jgi:hypothetical protein
LIGEGKVGEAKNFLYIIPGEDWGGGGRKAIIEKIYRKGGKPPPPPKKRHTKNLAIEKIYRTFRPYLRGKLHGNLFRGSVYIKSSPYIHV